MVLLQIDGSFSELCSFYIGFGRGIVAELSFLVLPKCFERNCSVGHHLLLCEEMRNRERPNAAMRVWQLVEEADLRIQECLTVLQRKVLYNSGPSPQYQLGSTSAGEKKKA